MAEHIKDVMTKSPATVTTDASIRDVARMMKELDVGNVLVTDNDGTLCGIVTDRDLVVRGVAIGKDAERTKVGEVCSSAPVGLPPEERIDAAVSLMRERAIRRIAVVEDGKPIGIVSIGDLAMAVDPNSALADISAAPANR